MLSAVFAVVVCLCVYVSVCVSVCHTPVLCHSHTVISTPLYTEWFTFLVQAYPRDHSKEADKWLLLLLDVCRLQQYQHCPLLISRCQGRSDGGGVYRYICPPKSAYFTNFYVVTGCFFLFDPGQIWYRASVCLSSCFFYLLTHHNLYSPPQNEIPGYAPGRCGSDHYPITVSSGIEKLQLQFHMVSFVKLTGTPLLKRLEIS